MMSPALRLTLHLIIATFIPASCLFAGQPPIKKPSMSVPITIQQFLKRHSSKQNIIAFDWDGTLYNERIISKNLDGKKIMLAGQPSWFMWAARSINHCTQSTCSYRPIFPYFKQYNTDGSINFKKWAHALAEQDLYLEGKYRSIQEDRNNKIESSPLPQGVYDKYTQTANMTAGMTLPQINQSVQQYLGTSHHQFPATLNVLRLAEKKGYTIWIITGSNPYFVANEIYHIDHALPKKQRILVNCYHLMHNVMSGQIKNLTADRFFKSCKIAGNASIWNGALTPFSNQYDARNTTQTNLTTDCRNLNNTLPCKIAVDRVGKLYALQHIENTEKKRIIMYAGNSDGDYSIMRYILRKHRFGIFVNPNYGNQEAKFNKLYRTSCNKHNCYLFESLQPPLQPQDE